MNANKTTLPSYLFEASEEGAEFEASEDLIARFIWNRMSAGDFNPGPWSEVQVDDNTADEWVKEFVKWLATPKFTTQQEAKEYLVTQGMPRPLAHAAVDQQYNWDDEGSNNELRWFDGERSWPTPQTVADLIMTKYTWEEMLELREDGCVLVDGELAYDANGAHV